MIIGREMHNALKDKVIVKYAAAAFIFGVISAVAASLVAKIY